MNHDRKAEARPSLLHRAVAEVQKRWPTRPRLGLILGTGSGGVADRLEMEATLDYSEVPGFVRSTATGHRSRIICGRLAGIPTIAMQGRFHRYEGWSFDQTVFPTRLMAALGIEGLVVTNAAGGVDPRMQAGDLIFLASHIDLLSYWPGVAPSPSHESATEAATEVDRRPPVRGDAAYCPRWRTLAQQAADRIGLPARAGVYVALPGPNYETRAEYRLIRKLGGDVVGMSTTPEVAIASLLGVPVLGISIVTNVARPDALEKTSGEAVVHAARDVEGPVAQIIEASVLEYLST
jgi:purine-nucleoside phosphorylase